jgi:prevent-host-death family protein
MAKLVIMTKTPKRRAISAAEAKAQFAETLRRVDRGEVVVITRYGKPVAALVGPKDVAQLERLRARVPEQGLAKLVGRWKDAAELIEALDQVAASRNRGRRVPRFD